MNFFDDCDLILKIHYDNFFKGPLDEDKQAIWTKLDKFYKICEQNLTTKEYGYVQAIHYQLTSDGYLIPIGDLNDLTHKTHRVTAKGYAFVLNGAYKQQVKTEKSKQNLNRINSFSSTLGWIVAAIFGGLQFYQSTKNNDEITTLKKEISQVQSKMVADSMQSHKRSLQQQNRKQIPLGKTRD
jgi:hypothetical protein